MERRFQYSEDFNVSPTDIYLHIDWELTVSVKDTCSKCK